MVSDGFAKSGSASLIRLPQTEQIASVGVPLKSQPTINSGSFKVRLFSHA
jgi:hypothetical protein